MVLEPADGVRSAFEPRRYLTAKKIIRKQIATEKIRLNATSDQKIASTCPESDEAESGNNGKFHMTRRVPG